MGRLNMHDEQTPVRAIPGRGPAMPASQPTAAGPALRHCLRGVAMATLCCTWVAAAGASTVPIDEIAKSYTVGTSGQSAQDSFTVSGPGILDVSLTDLHWLRPATDLSFQLSDSAGDVIGSMSGAGTATFSLTAGGTYFALTYGRADSSAAQSVLPFASYGIAIEYVAPAAVPLPGALGLLMSGLALLGAMRVRGLWGARGLPTPVSAEPAQQAAIPYPLQSTCKTNALSCTA